MNPPYIIFLSSVGLAVSLYLYYSKTHDKKIYCLIGHDCDDVVKSNYGKIFGIENTILGILHYGLILVYGTAIFFNRNIFKENILYYSIVSASIASVLFSIYLTGVQAFVLKKWCDYCIISTIVSILILLVLL